MAAPSSAISRTEYSTGFREFDLEASRRGFIGPRVLVPRAVGKQAADIASVPLEQLLANRETARAPRSGYARSDFTFGKFSYSCVEHGAEEPLPDAELAIYSDILDCESVHVGRAVGVVLRNYERAVAAAVFDAAVWTGPLTDTVGAAAWDDYENATPIDDVLAACRAVHGRTGLWPNTFLCNRRVFENLGQCDQVTDRIIYGGGPGKPAVVTAKALAAIFSVDQVLVADGAYNDATEGQDADIEPVWSDTYAMVCRTATSEDMAEPCIGRTFMFDGDGPGGARGEEIAVAVEEYREEAKRGSIIRARTYWDAKIILADAGHLITGVTTS